MTRETAPKGGSVLDNPAFYGLPGLVVRTIAPESEADPWALLLTFLADFGAQVGPGPHFLADGAKHTALLFIVLVGATSKARKGTARKQIERVMVAAVPAFVVERVRGGFGSGEALVDAVAGDDGRLLMIEPEWGRLLTVNRREGATLSPVLRQAWDGDLLAVRTRAGEAVAEDAHIAIIGHITVEELRTKLLNVEVANGFGNRHLFCQVHRSKLLPSGGNLGDPVVEELGLKVRSALEQAQQINAMRRTPAAENRWNELYYMMDQDDPGGLLGGVIARDAAQVLRLSVVYALTDGASEIDLPHLEAAWAVWSHCRRSASEIFGERTGDPVADRLLDAVRRAGAEGLTADQQHAALGRHTSGALLNAAREKLVSLELAIVFTRRTAGRPAVILVACEESEKTVTKNPLTSVSSLLSHEMDQLRDWAAKRPHLTEEELREEFCSLGVPLEGWEVARQAWEESCREHAASGTELAG